MTSGPAGAVVDAAALVDLVIGRPGPADSLLTRAAALHAPSFVDLEVLSALRRGERARGAPSDRIAQALAAFDEILMQRHPLPPLRSRVWQLREWLRITDAHYVALAEALRLPLVTTDLRLARGVRERGLVEVVTT